LATASCATTISTERGNASATTRSGPAPYPISRRANRFAAASSAANVRWPASDRTAGSSGSALTAAVNSSGSDRNGTSPNRSGTGSPAAGDTASCMTI